MVSKVIRTQIEQKFGKEIRYPLDCEALAFDIEQKCNERISASTLKRFFGFTQGTEPRTYTLDVLAKYIGFKNWDAYLDTFIESNESSEFKDLNELHASDIQSGDSIEFCYEPMRKIVFRCEKAGLYKIIDAVNSKLKTNDIITFSSIVLDYPLFISSVIRDSVSLGALTLGKVSGITSIKKTNA